jgi:F-type H+-transporting ATPase subunit b
MTFDWWTLALQAVNFLVLVWLLQRFLYKPVAGIIEKRRQDADKVMQEAERAKAEAEAARQDYENRMAEVAAERKRVLDEAHEAIGAERRAALDDARKEAEELIETARENIEKEKSAALKSLKGQIAELAGDMAAKLLNKAAPHVSDDSYLQAVCDKIDALPAKEKGRLRKSLSAEDASLTVVTAQPLSRNSKTEWRKKLVAALDPETRTQFATDSGLIGGAELRFPDAVLRVSWNAELGKLKQMFLRNDRPS